MLFIWYNF